MYAGEKIAIRKDMYLWDVYTNSRSMEMEWKECSTLGTTLKILSNTSVGQFLMIARFVWILIGDFKKVDNGAAVGVVDRCATNIVPTMIQVEVVMENWSKRNWKHKGSLWIMVQDHWALTHQLCLHLHTIIASDTGKMTTIGQIIQRGVMTVNLEESLIMNLDRRRIHVSVRVVILMKRKMMIGSGVLSFISRCRLLGEECVT
ncbi:uncharacterized protein LOC107777914 isoform X4 [Nicotiana tabacum]|uniref:Uncharacterized protein LOC107777914 isoform X4 n=1 Tax=Nicotiana tabacum TaxID=4097 RepID=A0AC58UMB5_TOBAC